MMLSELLSRTPTIVKRATKKVVVNPRWCDIDRFRKVTQRSNRRGTMHTRACSTTSTQNSDTWYDFNILVIGGRIITKAPTSVSTDHLSFAICTQILIFPRPSQRPTFVLCQLHTQSDRHPPWNRSEIATSTLAAQQAAARGLSRTSLASANRRESRTDRLDTHSALDHQLQ